MNFEAQFAFRAKEEGHESVYSISLQAIKKKKKTLKKKKT